MSPRATAPRHLKGLCLAVLWIVPLACSPADKGATAGTNESDRKLGQWVLDAYEARLRACWEDSIRAQVDDFSPDRFAYPFKKLKSALIKPTENGRAHLTEAGSQLCITAIEAATCTQLESVDPFAACRGLPLWEGTLYDSATCEHHGECRSGYCYHVFHVDTGLASHGRCEPPPHGRGVFCHEWPCDEGLECIHKNENDQVCTQMGEAPSCDRYRPCTDGLVCVQGLCLPPPEAGQPCASSRWPKCASGLRCVADLCQEALTTGQACNAGEECATDDWCIDGLCAPRPLAGEACSDELPCRDDVGCLTDFGEDTVASALPTICTPDSTLWTQQTLVTKLNDDAFCDGCPPIEVIEEGPCDVYAGPRVCKHALTTRFCQGLPDEIEGVCADRPRAGEACDQFSNPCVWPGDECPYTGVCEDP